MGMLRIVSWLCFLHCVMLVAGETDAGPDTGAGEEYLELTEKKWDGKTPWFTGSSMLVVSVSMMIWLSL